VPITLLWNAATMPNGCELFEESIRSGNRVRAFANRIGGVLADGGGLEERRIRVRHVISGESITDLRQLQDDWQAAVGTEFGWLRQQSATMDRRIYAKPDEFSIRYPETIFDWVEIEQTFLAPDPRWESLTSTTAVLIPSLRYTHGSALLSVTGSAGAEPLLFYWPAYAATEFPGTVEITNRYGNLLYNADFAVQTTSTQQGLAPPWRSAQWASAPYDPFLIPGEARQYLEIDAGATAQAWVTHATIPYAPTRNATSPTTDALVWSTHVDLSQLTGDWRFYLRLHALLGTAWGSVTANTVTSPIYGTTGAAVTVAGATYSGRIGVTLTATGGLSPHVRQLRPEFVFVGATGLGAVGGGHVCLSEPYVRGDGGGYDYRPHRTVTWSNLVGGGQRALQSNLSDRDGTLWAAVAAPTSAMPYLDDDAAFFELAPGSNELHARIALSGTQPVTGAPTVYPCSSTNLTYIKWTDRWWA